MAQLRGMLGRYEPILERVISDTLIAAWFRGAADVPYVAPEEEPESSPFIDAPPDEPVDLIATASEGEPVITFPVIEEAARDLLEREVVTWDTYQRLAVDAKREAFTVAHVGTLDALEKIQRSLILGTREGQTLKSFSESIADVIDESGLSARHVENVFRTNVASAYTAGLMEVLRDPIVADEFPYLEYTAVHDARTRHDHKAMETLGIQGTAIYRADDRVIQEFLPPWDFACRCAVIPLSLEDAAEKGIQEAIDWLRTGQPPKSKAWVAHPPFSPPPGWSNAGVTRLGWVVNPTSKWSDPRGRGRKPWKNTESRQHRYQKSEPGTSKRGLKAAPVAKRAGGREGFSPSGEKLPQAVPLPAAPPKVKSSKVPKPKAAPAPKAAPSSPSTPPPTARIVAPTARLVAPTAKIVAPTAKIVAPTAQIVPAPVAQVVPPPPPPPAQVSPPVAMPPPVQAPPVAPAPQQKSATAPALSRHHQNFLAKHHAAIDGNASLSPEHKAKYKQAMHEAIKNMPKRIIKRIARNIDSSHFVGDRKNFADALTHSLVKEGHVTPQQASEFKKSDIGLKMASGHVGGFYTANSKFKKLFLDGTHNFGKDAAGDARDSTHEVYAHELTHAIDGPEHQVSSHADWQQAFKDEIDQDSDSESHRKSAASIGMKTGKLSAYARTSTSEGFAEFGRLVYASGMDHKRIEQAFPKCYSFFKKRGMV